MLYSDQIFSHPYGFKIQQVNKNTAKKLYNQGEVIFLLSHKCRPETAWPFEKEMMDCEFWKVEAHFNYYQCTNETGKRILYFREVKL